MNSFFKSFFDCVHKKKAYFIILLIATIAAIILGVITAINFGGGVFAIDLEHISYIRFLKGDCGFGSLIFNMILSLSIFFIAIYCFNFKPFLIPLGIVFYLYLIYSQVVIFISIILIYGFLNCIILIVLLLIYDIAIWLIFLLIVLEINSFCNCDGYFKKVLSFKECKVLLYLICIILFVLVFSLILTILKSYVVLLIY